MYRDKEKDNYKFGRCKKCYEEKALKNGYCKDCEIELPDCFKDLFDGFTNPFGGK